MPTKNHVIFFILLLFTLACIIYALVGIPVKGTSYTFYGDASLKDEQGNTIALKRQIDFSAEGCFSAENKIHVKVTLYDCSANNLLNYVGEVGFTEAFYYKPTVGASVSATLPLIREPNGNYTAEGDLLWHTSQATYMYPIAPVPAGTMIYHNATELMQNNIPVLFISPVSDTLAFESSHTMEQLTWVIIGLTVIMLFPVITALIPEKQVINVRINGIDLTKLVADEKAKEEKEKQKEKKRRFWNKK